MGLSASRFPCRILLLSMAPQAHTKVYTLRACVFLNCRLPAPQTLPHGKRSSSSGVRELDPTSSRLRAYYVGIERSGHDTSLLRFVPSPPEAFKKIIKTLANAGVLFVVLSDWDDSAVTILATLTMLMVT